ncbi:MAG TPA: hypothetical protein VK255_01905, partial [Patescibacteria group bacterium]|nr:hypothetical protein [Patescibacteria group bacterium]
LFSVGVIVIVVIAITIGMLVWKYEKSIKINQQTSSQNNKPNLEENNNFEISNKWTLVSHENFWDNPNLFANRNYKFPNIEFSYPENWNFKCCGDMDHASEHIIYSSKKHASSLPYIRITDYVLSGCPNFQSTCPIDKTVKITANEKFNRLISNVSQDKILQKIELSKLSTSAFVYQKTEKNNKISKAYLLNLKDDVVEVDFVNYESLDENFINDFLNRISFESK